LRIATECQAILKLVFPDTVATLDAWAYENPRFVWWCSRFVAKPVKNRSSWEPQSALIFLPAVCALAFLANCQNATALTIIRDFIGGSPGTNDTGSGNLIDIFNAAADVWQETILDDHVLTLHFGWAPNGGGTHSLDAQGGIPHRETEGTILFNNDNVIGHHHYYLDPTPRLNEEFPDFIQIAQDMGGGTVNVTRVFRGGTGDAESEDLFTVALHEIGHALGMSMANTRFISESADGAIDISSPIPFGGTTIALATNNFGVVSHIGHGVDRVLMAGFSAGERVIPSMIDILAMAQLSQFTNLNLNLSPRLKVDLLGTNISVSWVPIAPGFVLQEVHDLHHTNWTNVPEPLMVVNGRSTVNLPRSELSKFFRLKMSDFGLAVSTSHDANDVNASTAGIQILPGTTVQYSGSAFDSEGIAVTWQWFYAVNGGEWNVVQQGSGPVPTVSYHHDSGSAGKMFVWTLLVFNSRGSAQSRSTVFVAPP
jgi:hypothetical protein